jgi:hypothetical protein
LDAGGWRLARAAVGLKKIKRSFFGWNFINAGIFQEVFQKIQTQNFCPRNQD